MRIQTLVATMNLTNHKKLLNKLNIGRESIVVNQVAAGGTKKQPHSLGRHTLLNYQEKGLSRSRNRALSYAEADICVIADDDMRYEDNYESIICSAYGRLPDADIIAFRVDSNDPRQQKAIQKEGRLNRISSMKIASWQITYKRKSMLDRGIKFDESFGAGTKNYMGEENIMLYDAIRAGMRVYYVPIKIATLADEEPSTWFEGYTKRYFVVKGAVYRRMSALLCLLFILQFSLRKYPIYRQTTTLPEATISMLKGATR